MIVQLHITDAKAAEILERNHIINQVKTVPKYRSAYHNRLEVYEVDELHAFHPEKRQWVTAESMIQELLINKI